MSEKYSIDQDLREAKAMTDGLENYIRGDQVYGSVSGGFFGGGNMPALTIGALAMRLRRLHALSLTDKQREELQAIQVKHEAIRKEWRNLYEQKLIKEANSRLDAMNPFFDECRSDPGLCARVYAPEVLRRTITEEIMIVLQDLNSPLDELKKKARRVDSSLRRVIQPAPFVWADELQSIYPDSQYWWMYSHPPEVSK
ncbi:MAG: hypothetical protein H7X77_08295 [Anaerolineae bacterium]|nr:hypothetical protein [Anaerolineae bacterium]